LATNKNLFSITLPLLVMCASALGAMAQTWQTILAYQLAPVKGAVGYALCADALGNVFCGGEAADASSTENGLVLRITRLICIMAAGYFLLSILGVSTPQARGQTFELLYSFEGPDGVSPQN